MAAPASVYKERMDCCGHSTINVNIDKSVNQLRLVVAGKQPDDEGCTVSDIRRVEVLRSTVQLEGRLLGLDAGQGLAGDVVTIIGALLDKNGAVPAQLMVAFVEGPDGTALMAHKDDGTQNDGAAGDGIDGALFGNTADGGGCNGGRLVR